MTREAWIAAAVSAALIGIVYVVKLIVRELGKPGAIPAINTRFRAARNLNVTGVVWYSAPFSTHFTGLIPAGEVLLLDYEPDPKLGGVHLVPERRDYYEEIFVDQKTRETTPYSHYSLPFSWRELERDFEVVGASH